MPLHDSNWLEFVELLSVAGFASAVLARLALSLYFLKYRPTNPVEDRIIRPYQIRGTTVYISEWEARVIGPVLGKIAVTCWALGLSAFLITFLITKL